MASASVYTRSTRRSEGLSTRSSTRHNVSNHLGNTTKQQPNIGRKKRRRDDPDDCEDTIIVKKPKFAVEILSRPEPLPRTRSFAIESFDGTSDLRTPYSAAPKTEETTTRKKQPAHESPKPQPPPTKKSVNHREKVVNGIKHELDRLQPQSKDLDKDEKRKLRSQEPPVYKSDLSKYFSDYDEVIGNTPKPEYPLNPDTSIVFIAKPTPDPSPPQKSKATTSTNTEYIEPSFPTLHKSQRVDFSFIEKFFKYEGGGDPLSDAIVEETHKKPERQERSVRNQDKNRAQHDKELITRLLEGLESHEWLKTLGVTVGLPESKRKEFEPARDYYVGQCRSSLEKFQLYREEERQRAKLEKEAALAESEPSVTEAEEAVAELADDEDDGNISDGDPPNYTNVDAAAARQLHEEAIARTAPPAKPSHKKKVKGDPVLAYEPPEKPFKSFFKKPHQREAALGKHRRSGRIVAAFGLPVPDVPETEFNLPEEYRDKHTVAVSERRRRLERRVVGK